MVSPNNEDDLMSQVFANVQLPEVKWTTETTHEVHKTVTVDHNGEHHVYTEHYVRNGEGHDSDDHKTVEHSHEDGYHGKADDDMVSQVFFSRPAVETFRVENGVMDSDVASERSSQRHFRESESDRGSHHEHEEHHGHEHFHHEVHHHDDDDHMHENGHIVNRVLETVPHKSQEQDNVIAQLKRQQTDDTSSDDETLKGDDDDHDHHEHHVQEEMWHHEPHVEEHIAHYDMPPAEPLRDYESARHSIAHSEPRYQEPPHDSYFNHASYAAHEHDSRSQRSNSINSEASRRSVHAPPSHHSSHHSIPVYPKPRDSRASSTSTLRSDRDIHIVTNHITQPPPKHIYHNGNEIDEEEHKVNPKGIHTYREYGIGGHRRSDASERSSVYNRESFTVGDIEYIQEKPKAPVRERTATKQSSISKPQTFQHDNRYRSDTKQSAISQRSDVMHRSPPKRLSLAKSAPPAPFVPNIDDSPIAPVNKLADQWGGRGHGINRQTFFPAKVEKHEEVHHSRASSKRGSDVSSVHSLKPITTKTGRSNTQHSVASQASRVSHVSHNSQSKLHNNRRDSTNSVGTQHTARVDKTPGKYDSIRVVKNVRTYKQFLDVWSQREIEDALEEGPIHAEPIPRPRYSISARHVYPELSSVKSTQKHRPSLRPSEKLNEFSMPGKVDKATSYHNLSVIGGGIEKRHSSIAPIHEEEEELVIEAHHHHMNGVASQPRSRNSTLKSSHHSDHEKHEHHEHHDHHEAEDDEHAVDIKSLRSLFEPHEKQSKSRRHSVQSTASAKNPGTIAIVPASHRHALDNAYFYSSRRRH